MALIKCSECHNEISSKARKCPHCGAPIAKRGSAALGFGCLGMIAVPALIFVWAATHAPPNNPDTGAAVPLHADECDTVAAKLVAREGAAINTRTTANVLILQHPLVHEMSLDCYRSPPNFAVMWNGTSPPVSFFDEAGRGANVASGSQQMR
jgi:zinc-ribbon domain